MTARPTRLFAIVLAAGALAVAGCAPSTNGSDDNADPATEDDTSAEEDDSADASADDEAAGEEEAVGSVDVGIIYSETGPLAAYGEQFKEGLEAGLDYATDGTGAVNGTEIELTYRDDAGNPDTAVAAAKDLIGQGYNIMGGTVVSGIAVAMAEQAAQNEILYISGPAATDATTGVNEYTFRSGRQSLQDVATAADFLPGEGDNKIVVLAQDNAFGQGNLAAVEAVLGGEGDEVTSVLVPENATEFTSFARQVIDEQPDLIFVAWAGASSGSMWQSLEQQEVFDVAPIVTGLGDSATFGAYGPVADKISFLNHYFPGAADNEANNFLIEHVEAAGGTPDLFTNDGFVMGQMIVQAVGEGGGEDVNEMISSLEGWEFEGPKGSLSIRESDHALIQPMFTVSLSQEGDAWVPELINTVAGDEVAPPEASGR